jgi:hypothetical protein
VTVTLQPQHEFIRGDSNLDGQIDISDPVAILDYLFQGEQCPCPLASDANADAALDIADAIAQLGFLFSSGAAPPAPFPDCGMAPEGGCVATMTCPVSGMSPESSWR